MPLSHTRTHVLKCLPAITPFHPANVLILQDRVCVGRSSCFPCRRTTSRAGITPGSSSASSCRVSWGEFWALAPPCVVSGAVCLEFGHSRQSVLLPGCFVCCRGCVGDWAGLDRPPLSGREMVEACAVIGW